VPEEIISEQFRRFFLSYSKSIKVQESRTGSLFEKNFKRKRVDSENYFSYVINYIHQNPVKHRICKNYQTYLYSSYSKVITVEDKLLKGAEVLRWFGNKEQFVKFHEANPLDNNIEHLEIED